MAINILKLSIDSNLGKVSSYCESQSSMVEPWQAFLVISGTGKYSKWSIT